MNTIIKTGLLALAALPALAACGGQSNDAGPSTAPAATSASSTPSSTPSTTVPATSPAVPACASVWVAGKVLPADYAGCMNGDTLEAAVSSGCGLVAYGKAWAKPGQVIKVAKTAELAADPEYKAAYSAC